MPYCLANTKHTIPIVTKRKIRGKAHGPCFHNDVHKNCIMKENRGAVCQDEENQEHLDANKKLRNPDSCVKKYWEYPIMKRREGENKFVTKSILCHEIRNRKFTLTISLASSTVSISSQLLVTSGTVEDASNIWNSNDSKTCQKLKKLIFHMQFRPTNHDKFAKSCPQLFIRPQTTWWFGYYTGRSLTANHFMIYEKKKEPATHSWNHQDWPSSIYRHSDFMWLVIFIYFC